MPIRLRAARASAMIRVLPNSNSLIVMWDSSAVATRVRYCAHLEGVRIATDVAPRRFGRVFRVTVLSGGFLALPASPIRSRGPGNRDVLTLRRANSKPHEFYRTPHSPGGNEVGRPVSRRGCLRPGSAASRPF